MACCDADCGRHREMSDCVQSRNATSAAIWLNDQPPDLTGWTGLGRVVSLKLTAETPPLSDSGPQHEAAVLILSRPLNWKSAVMSQWMYAAVSRPIR
jgi:hypothetical protein